MDETKQLSEVESKNVNDVFVSKGDADPATYLDLKNLKNETIEDLKKSRTDYIQIFGVFASIITLVGFNASAGQKSIPQILFGNLTLGIVLIGFIYLLYIIPEKIKEKESLFPFKTPKKITVVVILLITSLFLILLLMDRTTNLGLCSLYPFSRLEVQSITYCKR